ncbi:MAG: hypothetical protein BWY63_01093 [Chloroflexi bacterium ADurb.Bin360]|nr:MAG: hypothetical protein BWY63_01093 [Chloroflexi bacterium ADurb.Bin360]
MNYYSSASKKISRILLYVRVCATLVVVLLYVPIINLGLRNFAFVTLINGLSRPQLDINEDLKHSLDLFINLAEHDSTQYGPYQLRLSGLVDMLELERSRELGWHSSLDCAKYAEMEGEFSEAVRCYLEAIAYKTETVDESAFRGIARLLEHQIVQSDFQYNIYGDGEEFPIGRIKFDRCSGLELIIAYIGEHRIGFDRLVPIVMIWRLDNKDVSQDDILSVIEPYFTSSWHWQQSGNFIFQWGLVTNLLFDGGFERTVLPHAGFPFQLPKQLYSRQQQQHTQILYDYSQIGKNMALLLDGQGDTPVGLASLPIAISARPISMAYFVTGRYRTDDEAIPRIGLRWLLREAEEWNDNISSYLVHESANEWTPYAGISLPHPEAESFQYWVINADPSSRLYVDNLGVFEIPLPCFLD